MFIKIELKMQVSSIYFWSHILNILILILSFTFQSILFFYIQSIIYVNR